jgi:hypothetical protein
MKQKLNYFRSVINDTTIHEIIPGIVKTRFPAFISRKGYHNKNEV